MGNLEHWLVGIAAFIALAGFFYAAFDISRRLLARAALRICRMREATEGGFICELKRKLHGYAEPSLVPRLILLVVSFAVLVLIMVGHSPKL